MGKQRKLQIVVYFAFHSHTHTQIHIRRVVVRNETDTKGKSAQKTKGGHIKGSREREGAVDSNENT